MRYPDLTMPHARIAGTLLVLSLLAGGAACSRRAPAPLSRVTAVQARVDGITCPTCAPPLKASLKREYAKSTIEVDDDKDTATVRFAENENFSAPRFRAAV